MKKIIVVIFSLIMSVCFYACSDTKDCVCEVDGKQTTVSDWDKSCSDITANDVPNLGTNPCSEL